MDFEKKYNKELRVNKLDDEFISDLAEKMAKRRTEALSAAASEEEKSNVAIIKHDNRKIYINRIATAAAVAGLVLGLSYVTRIGTADAPDELSSGDEYDSFFNAHAETSAFPVPGSVTDQFLSTVPAAVTSENSGGISVFSVNSDIAKTITSEIRISLTGKADDNSSDFEQGQNTAVTSVPRSEGGKPETTVIHSGNQIPETIVSRSESKISETDVSHYESTVPSLSYTESRQVSSVTDLTSEKPVPSSAYPVTEPPKVSETVTTVTQVTEQPEVISQPDIPNKPIAGEGQVLLSAENVTAAPGDVFDVKISISSGINTMSTFNFFASFDKDIMEIRDVKVPSASKSSEINKKTKDDLVVLYLNSKMINHEFDRDDFIVLTIRIKDDAKPGKYLFRSHDEYGKDSEINYINSEKTIVYYPLVFPGFEITVTE